MGRGSAVVTWVLGALLAGCEPGDGVAPPPTEEPEVHTLPVVVHIVHRGEPVGVGANVSDARVHSQIRVLNEDFRREPGTPGFNTHPDGGDARIEFVLASVAPDGSPTDGIVRIDGSAVEKPQPPGSLFDLYASYGYWDPERYINVWTLPLDESTRDVFLGMATGPETDLPGAERLLRGEPWQAEGILVNSFHFGVSDDGSEHDLGRTLTHEMGHYLGLLHTWGGGECDEGDHVSDTPPVIGPVGGCPPSSVTGCDGSPVMVENYMNYTTDRCMSIFTHGQIARMRHVLETSPRRRTLPKSAGPAGAPPR